MVFRRGRLVISPVVGVFFLLAGLAQAQDAGPAPNADFIAGVNLVRDQQYQEAASKLQAATASQPNLEAAWYYLGVAQYNLGNLQEAVAAFQKAIDLRSARPETRIYIGRIYEQLGAYDEAIKVYGEELRLRINTANETAEVYNALTRAYFLAGKYRPAGEAGYQATRLDDNYVEALYDWARAEDALGNYSHAEKLFVQAKDILTKWSDLQTRLQRLTEQKRADPTITEEKVAQEYGRAEEFGTKLGLWPALNRALGMAYIHDRKFAQARNAFRSSMDAAERGNPQDEDGTTLVGVAYYKEGLDLLFKQDVLFEAVSAFQAAVKSINEALKKNPDWAPAHNALGEIYLTEAQTFISDPARGITSHTYDEAVTELKKAIELDPQYVDAMLNLAKAYYAQAQYDEALQQLGDAIRRAPNRADLHAALALTYVGLEKYDEARDEARAALQLDHKQIPAYNALGLAAYYQGRLGQAAEYFTKAVELDSTQHQSHTNLGLAYFQMHSWTRSRAELNQALKYLPQAVITNTAIQRSYLYYLVALTYSSTGIHDQAIAALNQALALDPTYFEALRQLARDYLAQKDYRAADRALRRALQQSPGPTEDAEVLAQLGLVHEAAGEPHQALAAYSEAITKDPNNLQAQDGFTRLQAF